MMEVQDMDDFDPAVGEACDILHAVISELLDRGFQITELIEAVELHLQSMRRAAQQTVLQ